MTLEPLHIHLYLSGLYETYCFMRTTEDAYFFVQKNKVYFIDVTNK